MHTVEERCVRSHFGWERVKEAGCFQQHIHTLIVIADENHRSGCGFFFLSTSKGSGRHIVLHDLDAAFILEVDTGNLVKRHAVLQADQAHSFSSHVVEQVCNGSLTAGNENCSRQAAAYGQAEASVRGRSAYFEGVKNLNLDQNLCQHSLDLIDR